MNSQSHFSNIAENYKELRTTDSEPMQKIEDKLHNLSRIAMVDVGCGDGRYSMEVCRRLGQKVSLHCVDANQEMLNNLNSFFSTRNVTNFQTHQATAEELPFADDSINCVLTMNAIHHFKFSEFLNEVSRILTDNGFLFIYTRYRSQNRKNIWGRYFPLFNEKETRLFEMNELEAEVEKNQSLVLQSSEVFGYDRSAEIDSLIHQAENHHYSTFYLYEKGEFEHSVTGFREALTSNFGDNGKVEWTDENTLLTIKREPR